MDLLLSACQSLVLSLRLVENNRLEWLRGFSSAPFIIDTVITTSVQNSTDGNFGARAKEILGVPLYLGACEVEIPESLLKRAEYISISVGHSGLLTPSEAEMGLDWRHCENAIYLEFCKRRLHRKTDRRESFFLVLNRREANRRLNMILNQFELRWDEPATLQAMENLTFAIYGGGDTSLLTENHGETTGTLDHLVYGALNNASLQLRRDQLTHGGLARNGRHVLDELPIDIEDSKCKGSSENSSFDLKQRREIIRAQIREAVQRPDLAMLVEQCLCDGKCCTSIAQELGLPVTMARNAIRRARVYLGLA